MLLRWVGGGVEGQRGSDQVVPVQATECHKQTLLPPKQKKKLFLARSATRPPPHPRETLLPQGGRSLIVADKLYNARN